MLSILLTVASLLALAPGQAVGALCASAAAASAPTAALLAPVRSVSSFWRRYESYETFNFSSFARTLILSDGGKMQSQLMSLGPRLAQPLIAPFRWLPPRRSVPNPKTMYVTSDFARDVPATLRLDNNHLPFAANTFNAIIMNRGLCPCDGVKACGGIEVQLASMRGFLNEVIRVLDKNDPGSIAIMTGFYYPAHFHQMVPAMWRRLLAEKQAELPELQLVVLSSRNHGAGLLDFIGFAISPTREIPIEQNMERLAPGLADPR